MIVGGIAVAINQIEFQRDTWPVNAWPSEDIVLLLVVCARINRPFILPARLHCPHVAIPLHGYWAIYDPPPDPRCVCHTPYNIGNGNIV